jgi:hypothetical protein
MDYVWMSAGFSLIAAGAASRTDYVWISAVFSVIAAMAAIFFGAYFKKNFASREDIDKLGDQMRAVTQAMKEIEASMSSDTWNQRKRWELKRAILFDAAKRVAELDKALLALHSLLCVDNPDDKKWAEARLRATKHWNDATTMFDETKQLVGIVCDEATVLAFSSLGALTSDIGARLVHRDRDVYKKMENTLSKGLTVARLAIRKELGMEELPVPQSGPSSAALAGGQTPR